AARADVHAAHAKPDLDRRLRAADPADRGLRGAAAALARDRQYRCADRSGRRAAAAVDVARAVGLSRRGALRPLDRGDRAYLHRYRRRAAHVGAAAVAVSADPGAGVPGAAAGPV